MRKQIAIVSALTVASQLSAFIKLWFIARIFGVGPELDGYNLAIVLPTLIAGVIAGVMQTGLFPLRAKLNLAGDASALVSFERSVLLGMAILGGFVTLLLLLGSPFILNNLSRSVSGPVRTSLAFVFPLAAALIALNFVGDCCGYLLAMRNRFATAAGAPVANGLLGAALLAAWPEGRLLNLITGTVLGAALQVSICLWGLKSAGFSPFGPLPAWATTRRHWREILTLGGMILPGIIFSNLVVSLPQIWIAQYGEGAVSAFGYAYRLHMSALQLLVIASSTVILARFSDLVAQGNVVAVRRILTNAGLVSVIVGLLGLLAVWLLGSTLLQWLFNGRFDGDAATRVTSHWFLLTIGLPFAMLGNVFSKLFQAQKKPLMMSAMPFANLLAIIFFIKTIGSTNTEDAIPTSVAIGSIASLSIGFMYFRKSSRKQS